MIEVGSRVKIINSPYGEHKVGDMGLVIKIKESSPGEYSYLVNVNVDDWLPQEWYYPEGCLREITLAPGDSVIVIGGRHRGKTGTIYPASPVDDWSRVVEIDGKLTTIDCHNMRQTDGNTGEGELRHCSICGSYYLSVVDDGNLKEAFYQEIECKNCKTLYREYWSIEGWEIELIEESMFQENVPIRTETGAMMGIRFIKADPIEESVKDLEEEQMDLNNGDITLCWYCDDYGVIGAPCPMCGKVYK